MLAVIHEDPTLEPCAIAAIAIGYEVGTRIAASRDLRTLDTVITGRWCGQGAAAAIGWLKRMLGFCQCRAMDPNVDFFNLEAVMDCDVVYGLSQHKTDQCNDMQVCEGLR